MPEYISREAAIELGYWHGEKPTVDNPFPDGVDAVDTVDIENLPAADIPEPKYGSWSVAIGYDPKRAFQCSECSRMAYEPSNYCPYCGASMILKEEDYEDE